MKLNRFRHLDIGWNIDCSTHWRKCETAEHSPQEAAVKNFRSGSPIGGNMRRMLATLFVALTLAVSMMSCVAVVRTRHPGDRFDRDRYERSEYHHYQVWVPGH